MGIFSKHRQNLSKIFILGSYHPDYIGFLDNLRNSLISKGFPNTFLASDKNILNSKTFKSQDHKNLEKVEFLLENSEYCLFIFFQDYNESLKVELQIYLKSNYFPERKKKYLVLIPYGLKFESMLRGIIDQQEVSIFSYFDISEIEDKCVNFVLYN